MKNIEKIILMWGVFDLSAVVWYMGWNFYYGKLPIANDAQLIIENVSSLGIPSLAYVLFFGLLIYLSLLLSGFFLVSRKKAGAVICYLQTPFRLLLVIPPSIFFILWPLRYLFEKPPILLGILLVGISEVFKIITVGKWHRSIMQKAV